VYKSVYLTPNKMTLAALLGAGAGGEFGRCTITDESDYWFFLGRSIVGKYSVDGMIA
jgi:hypothetical protein